MITLADDDGMGKLTPIVVSFSYEFDRIKDAGEFTSDEDAYWACEIDGIRYHGDAITYDRQGIPTNPPAWATHIYWFEA
jgi:hypothetical protein